MVSVNSFTIKTGQWGTQDCKMLLLVMGAWGSLIVSLLLCTLETFHNKTW